MACSPTYNWRELALDGGLKVLLPCKPEHLQRKVQVLRQTWDMSMHACEAGGQNWVLSEVEVTDPAQLMSVQRAINEAVAGNLATHLGQARVPESSGLKLAQEVQRYELHGQRPDGAAVSLQVWSFVRGTRVYQASVLQPEAEARAPDAQDAQDAQDARDTFFSALHFEQ